MNEIEYEKTQESAAIGQALAECVNRYNHMYSIGFLVTNGSKDGKHTCAAEVREAILNRLAEITDSELLESSTRIISCMGHPEDTEEESV